MNQDLQFGVTLFNLRDHCKTESDLDTTLGRVRDIGYQNIQVSGLGPIAPEKVRELADKHQLNIVASHERGEGLRNNMADIIHKLKVWDCDFTALGSTSGVFDWKPESIPALLNELESWGQQLKDAGLKLGFHNHHQEFMQFNGRTLIESIYSLPKDIMYAEIDVHWVQRGGANPVDWIYKVDGRMPVVHFKDFAIVDGEPRFCEIGEGNLDWKNIIKACKETNVKYAIVEQDQPFGDKDIFDSMTISYDNLVAMGL